MGSFDFFWRLRLEISRFDPISDWTNNFSLNSFGFLLNSVKWGTASRNWITSWFYLLRFFFSLLSVILIWIFGHLFKGLLRDLFSLLLLDRSWDLLRNFFKGYNWGLGRCLFLLLKFFFFDFSLELINHVLHIFKMFFRFPCRLFLWISFP